MASAGASERIAVITTPNQGVAEKRTVHTLLPLFRKHFAVKISQIAWFEALFQNGILGVHKTGVNKYI